MVLLHACWPDMGRGEKTFGCFVVNDGIVGA